MDLSDQSWKPFSHTCLCVLLVFSGPLCQHGGLKAVQPYTHSSTVGHITAPALRTRCHQCDLCLFSHLMMSSVQQCCSCPGVKAERSIQNSLLSEVLTGLVGPDQLAPTISHPKVVPVEELKPKGLWGCGCFPTLSAHPPPRVPTTPPPLPSPAMVTRGSVCPSQPWFPRFGNQSQAYLQAPDLVASLSVFLLWALLQLDFMCARWDAGGSSGGQEGTVWVEPFRAPMNSPLLNLVIGGGDVKIENQKLNFKEKAQAKVGSLDNVGHSPAGGTVKVGAVSSATLV